MRPPPDAAGGEADRGGPAAGIGGPARPSGPPPPPTSAIRATVDAPPCAPSAELLRALPALRRRRGEPPPPALAAAVEVAPEVAARWARRWAGSTWVVPLPPCGAAVQRDLACLAREDERGGVERVLCASARRIREDGAWATVRRPEGPLVTGFPPSGVREVQLGRRGRARTFAALDGVFVAVPPEGVTSGLRLRFR